MRVVSFEEELAYLAKTSQPLKDIAQIILDTGLRPEEVFRIRIENLDFGERTIFNPFGKTKAARRKVTMTAEVTELLKRRMKKSKGSFVFPAKCNPERPIGSVRKAHDAAVENAGIKEHFRLYDLRHTFARMPAGGGGSRSANSFRHPWTHEYPNDYALRTSSRGAEACCGWEVRDFQACGNCGSDGKKSAGHYNSRYSAVKTTKAIAYNLLRVLVGAPGFEPGASCAQGRRATRLRYAPT